MIFNHSTIKAIHESYVSNVRTDGVTQIQDKKQPHKKNMTRHKFFTGKAMHSI